MGEEKQYFVENLSLLVGSGMNILDALEALQTDMRSQRMHLVLGEIRENIEAGSSLWSSLEAARLFPEYTISIIRVGEDSGNLAENLRVVSLEQEKSRNFQAKIRSAMMYPVFVLALTVIIGIGIAWFILPKLAVVFSQLRVKLPLITQIIIGLGKYLGQHGTVVVPITIVVLALLIYFIFYFPRTKALGQGFLFIVPGVGRLVQEVEISRFGFLLGTLLQAGLPVTQAISSLSQATSFPPYRRFYEFLVRNIEDGNSFQKSFANYKNIKRLLPTPIQQLVITGEKSGTLPDTLLSISRVYEGKTELTTKNLAVILEPILLVIVWLGVVTVALAVILPIYSLIGGLQTS